MKSSMGTSVAFAAILGACGTAPAPTAARPSAAARPTAPPPLAASATPQTPTSAGAVHAAPAEPAAPPDLPVPPDGARVLFVTSGSPAQLVPVTCFANGKLESSWRPGNPCTGARGTAALVDGTRVKATAWKPAPTCGGRDSLVPDAPLDLNDGALAVWPAGQVQMTAFGYAAHEFELSAADRKAIGKAIMKSRLEVYGEHEAKAVAARYKKWIAAGASLDIVQSGYVPVSAKGARDRVVLVAYRNGARPGLLALLVQPAKTSTWIDLMDSSLDERSRVMGAVDLDGNGKHEVVYVAHYPGYEDFIAWVLSPNYSADERFAHNVASAKCAPTP